MKFINKNALRRNAYLQSASVVAALPLALVALAPTAAFAADDNTKDCATDPTASGCEEAIVVTGSRIAQDVFNSPSPITIITRDDASAAGFNSTVNLLQSTAVTAGSRQIDNTFTGFIVDGGPGANTLSLRGLGAARTLILLDGRRISPSGTSGSVLSGDLNVLPNAMVDRIEILKDGASSIYGSDAIAGVVNIITKKKLNGLYLEGGVSVPEVGEGTTRRIAVIGGYTTDRFNVTASLEVYDRSNLTFGAHDYLKCQTDFWRSGPGAADNSGDYIDPVTGAPKCYPSGLTGDGGVTVNTIGTSTMDGGAGGPGNPAIGKYSRWRYNPSAGGSVPGWEGVNGGNPLTGLGNRDTYNGKLYNQSLISPTTNYNAYLQASYDLHGLGDAQLYFNGLYTRRESSQSSFFQMILDYRQGSPLIPTELAFSNIGPTDQSGGYNVGVRVFSSRNYTSRQTVDFLRLGGGIRGNLPFSDWKYDLYVGQSYNWGQYFLQQPITSRLIQSQGVVSNGSGGYVCADTSNGCVAAPMLTGALVNGDVPQAYLDFIAPEVKGTTKFNETTVSAQLTGSLFELPGGKVGVALGAEYRRQKIDDQPSIEQQTGQLYSYSTAGVTQGTDNVKELFGEIELPLLRNRPFFNILSLNGSVRYTDYKSYGSGWTYKFGGIWAPTNFISFRGTYGTSYRAPALSEQYQAPTAGFLSSTTDPCYQYYTRASTSTRYINCAAAGVPLQYGSGNAGDPLAQSVRVFNEGGAATGLAAETSKNWTVGAVLQPKLGTALGSFELAVDYFNIKVTNGVAQLGAGSILNSCYDDPEFANGHLGGELCRLITRDSGTSANPYRATVTSGYVNISESRVRGIDFNLRYSRSIGKGKLVLNAEATRFLEQSDRTFPTDPLYDNNGQIYYPKWTGVFNASYSIGPVKFYYGLNWVGKMDSYEATGEDPSTSPSLVLNTPNYFTHTASLSFDIEKNYSMTLGVTNFTDKDPPMISAGYYNRLGNSPLYSGYDFVGRTFFMNFSAKM